MVKINSEITIGFGTTNNLSIVKNLKKGSVSKIENSKKNTALLNHYQGKQRKTIAFGKCVREAKTKRLGFKVVKKIGCEKTGGVFITVETKKTPYPVDYLMTLEESSMLTTEDAATDPVYVKAIIYTNKEFFEVVLAEAEIIIVGDLFGFLVTHSFTEGLLENYDKQPFYIKKLLKPMRLAKLFE